jgi:hypothetical protein
MDEGTDMVLRKGGVMIVRKKTTMKMRTFIGSRFTVSCYGRILFNARSYVYNYKRVVGRARSFLGVF